MISKTPCTKRPTFPLLIVFFVLTWTNMQMPGEEIITYPADLSEAFPGLKLGEIAGLIQDGDSTFFLESYNHRLLAIKDGKIVHQIGGIGQGKGEFYYPRDFAIDDRSNFYVLDFIGKGINRVQYLDPGGKYLAGFNASSRAWGFAIDSSGHILMGMPALKEIITVHDTMGKRLAGFGKLVLPSEVYGGKYESSDKYYTIPMNRVNIAVDKDDNTWVSFLFMPLVLKYDKKGDLILKKVIGLPGLEPVKEALWKPGSKEAKKYLSMNLDGIQMPVMIKDIIYNESQSTFYLLLGNDTILAMSTTGEYRHLIKPVFTGGAIEKFFLLETGDIIIRFFYHPECYRLKIRYPDKNQKLEEK